MMSTDDLAFIVVIPARLGSTRLPNKPLLDIAGKPMVIHVAERARASGAQKILIATDDQSIVYAAQKYNFESMLTQSNHASGTDRLAEVARFYKWPDESIIVNVQGDEPLIEPLLIRQVAEHLLINTEASLSTLAYRIDHDEEIFNPNVVKVVLDKNDQALYFSRAPIPWNRESYNALTPSSSTFITKQNAPTSTSVSAPSSNTPSAYRHIGLYAYRAHFLRNYPELPQAPFEQTECLEQLRALWHGHRIAVRVVQKMLHISVDTAEDLEQVRQLIHKDFKH